MLKRCNYTVTCCSRGSEAISLLRQKRNDFDLVLSDVIMPDVNGFRLLEIVGLEIDVPVISKLKCKRFGINQKRN